MELKGEIKYIICPCIYKVYGAHMMWKMCNKIIYENKVRPYVIEELGTI